MKEKKFKPVQHGIDCIKIIHTGKGYLHDDKDDSPYDVDGCVYCGRCHTYLDSVTEEKENG